MTSSEGQSGASPKGLIAAVVGYAGLAMCLTLVYLAMRAVMDVGGSCADGGPYVSAQSCPEGSTIALMGGIFAGLGFAFLATIGGAAVGGIWAGAPFMAWTALFGSLGWNFLDYGVFNAPPEYGIDGGALISGVVFWVMAAGGLVPLVALARSKPARSGSSGSSGSSGGATTILRGPGQPRRGAPTVMSTGMTIVSEDGHTFAYPNTDWGDQVPDDVKAKLQALEEQLERSGTSAGTEAGREQLARLAADFGAAVGAAAASMPIGEVVPPGGITIIDGRVMRPGGVSPLRIVTPAGGAAPEPATDAATADGAAAEPATDAAPAPEPGSVPGPEPEFTEGTQALLDRLERLADMRDRNLLGADEYETAKAAIMAELEGRS